MATEGEIKRAHEDRSVIFITRARCKDSNPAEIPRGAIRLTAGNRRYGYVIDPTTDLKEDGSRLKSRSKRRCLIALPDYLVPTEGIVFRQQSVLISSVWCSNHSLENYDTAFENHIKDRLSMIEKNRRLGKNVKLQAQVVRRLVKAGLEPGPETGYQRLSGKFSFTAEELCALLGADFNLSQVDEMFEEVKLALHVGLSKMLEAKTE